MTDELKQIIRDINLALRPHGLIVTARQLMEQEQKHTTPNPPNPHPDAHPDGLARHPDGHPEAGQTERDKRLAAKRRGLMSAMTRARGQGG